MLRGCAKRGGRIAVEVILRRRSGTDGSGGGTHGAAELRTEGRGRETPETKGGEPSREHPGHSLPLQSGTRAGAAADHGEAWPGEGPGRRGLARRTGGPGPRDGGLGLALAACGAKGRAAAGHAGLAAPAAAARLGPRHRWPAEGGLCAARGARVPGPATPLRSGAAGPARSGPGPDGYGPGAGECRGALCGPRTRPLRPLGRAGTETRGRAAPFVSPGAASRCRLWSGLVPRAGGGCVPARSCVLWLDLSLWPAPLLRKVKFLSF